MTGQIRFHTRRATLACLALAAGAMASGTASNPAAASTPSHGWDDYCGSSNNSQGWYDVKAYNVSCHLVRNRVAKVYVNRYPDQTFNGWRCDSDQVAYDYSRVDCTRRVDGRHQHVRFNAGG